jgi:hypothetical protein
MDTSKEYIKMCIKAVEIQRLWKSPPDLGLPDFVACCDHGLVCDIDEDREYRCDECPVYPDNLCWLPRQDQLQEMIPGSVVTVSAEILRMNSLNNSEWSKRFEIHHMEKLWLAFVMHKKFSKIWNGEDWVPDKT